MFFKNTWPAFLWAVIILALTLAPEPALPRVSWIHIPHFDKIVHAVLFGVQYLLLMHGFMKQYSHEFYQRAVVWTIAAVILYGAVTEILQAILPTGRDGNVPDWLADCAGTGFAFIAYGFQRKIKKKSA